METPDANVADAWAFMELTNEHLAPYGLFARGLYNHSPSFVWDVSFFIESTELAGKGMNYNNIPSYLPLHTLLIYLQHTHLATPQHILLVTPNTPSPPPLPHFLSNQ